MPRFAMMNGISVENVIMADDKDAAERSLRCTLIPLDDQSPIGFGWQYIEGEWIAPALPPSDGNNYSWDETAGEWVLSPTIDIQE